MDRDSLEFSQIYEAYQPKILRYVARLAGEADAEDLTQEVFVKVERALADFRGESSLATWIYRIATRTAIDWLRSPASRTAPITLHDESPAGEPVEIEDRDAWTGEKPLSAEQALFRQQMNACIRDFIERLPPHYRTVLVLSELEGIPDREIADILGVTLNTVKIRLHRARVKLRVELVQHCDPSWVEGNEFLPDLKHALENYRQSG